MLNHLEFKAKYKLLSSAKTINSSNLTMLRDVKRRPESG